MDKHTKIMDACVPVILNKRTQVKPNWKHLRTSFHQSYEKASICSFQPFLHEPGSPQSRTKTGTVYRSNHGDQARTDTALTLSLSEVHNENMASSSINTWWVETNSAFLQRMADRHAPFMHQHQHIGSAQVIRENNDPHVVVCEANTRLLLLCPNMIGHVKSAVISVTPHQNFHFF